MRFTYDPRHNVAYIRFQEKGTDVEAIRVGDEIVLHMAADGTRNGIELLNANQQPRRDDTRVFVVVNDATGERQVIQFRIAAECWPLAGKNLC